MKYSMMLRRTRSDACCWVSSLGKLIDGDVVVLRGSQITTLTRVKTLKSVCKCKFLLRYYQTKILLSLFCILPMFQRLSLGVCPPEYPNPTALLPILCL